MAAVQEKLRIARGIVRKLKEMEKLLYADLAPIQWPKKTASINDAFQAAKESVWIDYAKIKEDVEREIGFLTVYDPETGDQIVGYDPVIHLLDACISAGQVHLAMGENVRRDFNMGIGLIMQYIGKLEQKKGKTIETEPISDRLNRIGLPQDIKTNVFKALKRLDEEPKDMRDSIMSCGLAAEALTEDFFKCLYGSEESKRVTKWDNRIKRIWNDENLEKKKEGVRVIASLLSATMWYRHKMGAHARVLTPSEEAARLSLMSILQAAEEMCRLNVYKRHHEKM